MPITATDFELHGHLDIPQLLSQVEVDQLRQILNSFRSISAGDRRLLDHDWCRNLVPPLLQRLQFKELISGEYVAVLCTYFDKSDETNWGVAPHRDTCVPMKEEFSLAGWSNWTRKQDIPHVQPPTSFMRRMFAVRINIDHSGRTNGALLVASGSHISEDSQKPHEAVEGGPGDALMMSPLLLHASQKSETGRSRRILHFLFGPATIDSPASWFYAV